MQAEEQGSKLTNEELTANIILLFGAGHETTVNPPPNARAGFRRLANGSGDLARDRGQYYAEMVREARRGQGSGSR